MKKILISSILAGMMCATMATAEVYATVDGQKITEKEVNAFFKKQNINVDFNKLNAQDKERIINDLVIQRLILSEAMKEKIEKDKEYKDLLSVAKQKIAVDLWLKQQGEKLSKNIKITPEEIKKFYGDNPNQFIMQQAHLRQIVVKTKEEADKIIAELKGKKGDALQSLFIKLANEKSIDAGTQKNQNGGDLGTINRSNQLPPQLSDSIFALAPQTIMTTPFQTEIGYHIFFLQSKTEEKKLTLAESEEAIKNFLYNQAIGKKLEEKIAKMKEKAKVTINPIK